MRTDLLFRFLRPLVLMLVSCTLASCWGTEDARIRELLVEKGFGTRSQGVATHENYLTGGDAVVFLIDPTILVQQGAEQLILLTSPQQVGIDGTIHVPYVGSLPVLGMTERELEDLVKEQLQGLYTFELDLTARIQNGGKSFYVFGEALRKGRQLLQKADMTIFEVIAVVGTTQLANIGRIHLIRPDAQNPLVVEVNFREMVLTGNMTYNIPIQDNDIIYVPPTILGVLTRFIQKILQPITLTARTLLSLVNAEFAYERAFGNRPNNRAFFFRF